MCDVCFRNKLIKSLPIPVLDLCCAVSGANISSQHLERGCFSCSIHPQQTKALQADTHHLVTLKHLNTVQYDDRMTSFLKDCIDIKIYRADEVSDGPPRVCNI